MAEKFGKLLSGAIEGLVRWIVVPVTGVIPFLVSSGILLAVFAALWLGFGAGLVVNQSAVEEAWRSIGGLPLPILGLAWLLFLPLMAGLWVWTTSWPLAIRLFVIAVLAGWNLLVFIPRRAPKPGTAVEPKAVES
jgi:hypothetical protein